MGGEHDMQRSPGMRSGIVTTSGLSSPSSPYTLATLERKKRVARAYHESYFVLTAASNNPATFRRHLPRLLPLPPRMHPGVVSPLDHVLPAARTEASRELRG
ncbi:hypothetical protein C0992_008008 [Termitomyces sp. T32_za158]|nr:hypothetical protein C0992_008008 [Termitomyces sp. T32_za158]